MRLLKTLVYKLTGERNYLLVVSSLFFFLYRRGFLKLFNKFDTHYIAPALVKKGWIIIDIGANLGYYTVILAEATGNTGKLYAVEPVGDYRIVLNRNISKLPWVDVIPYALGNKNGTVRMIIPGRDKTRHGLTRISDGFNGKESLTEIGNRAGKDAGESGKGIVVQQQTMTADQNSSKNSGESIKKTELISSSNKVSTGSGRETNHTGSKVTRSAEATTGGWDVEIRRPADLFGDIETVHYIKCDIEGYEAKLFPELMPLIRKSKPIIQVEISEENRSFIKEMIIPEGYSSFRAERGWLIPENAGEIKESDVIFIPDEKIGDYSELIDN